MALGERLKQARILKNISQEYMANALNVSQKTYSNFENNKSSPSFSQIEEISKILETSVLFFLAEEKMAFYQTNSSGANNGLVINQLSERLIEQYEMHIKRLEEEVSYLKSLLDKLVK